jgi:hypothetical protein
MAVLMFVPPLWTVARPTEDSLKAPQLRSPKRPEHIALQSGCFFDLIASVADPFAIHLILTGFFPRSFDPCSG